MINIILQMLLGPDYAKKMAAQASNAFNPNRATDADADQGPRPQYKMNAQFPKAPAWIKRTGIIAAVVLVLLFIIISVGSTLGTDILWFRQLGFLNVLKVQYLAPVVVFLIGLVVATICSLVSLELVYNLRAKYQVGALKTASVDDLRSKFSKRKTLWFFLISLIVGIFYGLALADSTRDLLLMTASNPFGQTDPIFGLDVSFYVFILPGLESILWSLIGLFIIMLILAFITGSIFGQTKSTSRKLAVGQFNLIAVNKPLRVQLSIYATIISLLVAVVVYLQQYDLLNHISDKITGAQWTDANVRIPAFQICAGLLVLIAILFIITAFSGKVKLPLISIGVVAVFAVLIVGVAPAVMQSLKVSPNQQELEKPYIQANIEATKAAFNLDDVDVQQYNATTDAKAGQLGQDAETTAQIRLLDPQIVSPTFRQLQQNKQYYGFPDALSVDKYTINGKSHDTVIAARELDITGSDAAQRNWTNDHTVFTHGFGVVAAYGNKITNDGRPYFYEKDIPTDGELTGEEGYQPRIYFSQKAPEYSIVGAPEGQSWEFDYPESKETVTFDGNGGPRLANPFVKLLYALRFSDYQMFFTDRVNNQSQILYNRDPAERVQAVAPYLELDGRVYPAVVDGGVKWILDGYTTTDRYPYSKKINLADVTKDTVTETSSAISSLDSTPANYIKNSVKATVDAYDGSVTLYAWDADDPILKAWSKIYGQELHPISEISGDLMSHIRYPENLFKIQRSLLANYHVSDASTFFSGEDFWQVPQDPTTQGTVTSKTGTKESNVKQPPYYLTLQMPGVDEPTFSLTTSFIPGGSSKREILTGFLSADSDAGNQAGVVGPNYGKLHLLELPKNTTVPGPGQAQNNFKANADVSKELNLLSGSSSSIQFGNLLTLPVGGGLIYVQPVYVQATGNTSFPLLKKVLVAFGDKVGFSDTLEGALNQVFGGNSGAPTTSTVVDGSAPAADQPAAGQPDNSAPADSSDGSSAPTQTYPESTDKSAAIDQAKQALDQAKKALEDAQKALDSAK